MTIKRILFFTFSFGLALLAGFKAGQNFNIFEYLLINAIDETATPRMAIPNNDQVNLLIIGADDAKKADAQLESIWLAAHAKGTSNVTLIPIFPSPDNPVQNLILADAFGLENGKPRREFWEAMRNINIWWKGYYITDMFAAIEMIDKMGGITIHNRVLDSSEFVSSIPPWESDPVTAVKYQKLLFEGLCNQIANNQTANINAASVLISNSYRSIVKTNQSFTSLVVQSNLPGKLTCTFPTLDQVPSMQQ